MRGRTATHWRPAFARRLGARRLLLQPALLLVALVIDPAHIDACEKVPVEKAPDPARPADMSPDSAPRLKLEWQTPVETALWRKVSATSWLYEGPDRAATDSRSTARVAVEFVEKSFALKTRLHVESLRREVMVVDGKRVVGYRVRLAGSFGGSVVLSNAAVVRIHKGVIRSCVASMARVNPQGASDRKLVSRRDVAGIIRESLPKESRDLLPDGEDAVRLVYASEDSRVAIPIWQWIGLDGQPIGSIDAITGRLMRL